MTHENIYYLLPLVHTCEYVYIYPRVSGIHGFGFGDGFPPESVSGSGSGFDFGFRFWVHGDSTRSEPDPLPFLVFSLYSGLVRRNPCSLPAGLSYVALSPDGAPGEGCLTEASPAASGHTRWRNEVRHRGNHHYGEGRQRLRTPPPVVSRGPRERRYPLVRESCWLSPYRKIRTAGVSGLARSLSWPACLSGGAVPLERTSRVTGMALTRGAGMALTRGARSGGRHVSREVGLQDPVA